MSKRNYIVGVVHGNPLTLATKHFTVEISFKGEAMVEDLRRTSQRIDSFVLMNYNVTTRTSYATEYQIKKFLRKFMMDTIKSVVNQYKEM